MRGKLYRWEAALAFGVVFALVWGVTTAKAQEDLAHQVVRLHVVANSDAPEDQAMKLLVRDAVLAEVAACSDRAGHAGEMAQLLQGKLPELEKVGEEVLARAGSSLSVSAQLTSCWFPTRHYNDFSLPAGEYTALRLVIGAGEGQNWWCVAFPPLCVGASSQSIDQAVLVGHFTQEQGALLTADRGEYVLRFKSMELLGQIKGLIFREG